MFVQFENATAPAIARRNVVTFFILEVVVFGEYLFAASRLPIKQALFQIC